MNEIKSLQSQLLKWYQKHGRHSLPWRDKSSNNRAYRVLISEIMLQQTQVKSVLERFYFPFLESFPNLKALKQAKEEEVLRQWRGLGYYTRARNLHKLAQITQTLPRTKEELKKLPGIGEYTAGAIACFGFDEVVSFVDSNIKRFLIRFFNLTNPTPKQLEAKAKEILNTKEAFNHNQALMDLGALICTSKNPKCLLCPLQSLCLGKHNLANLQTKATKSLIKKTLNIAILEKNSAFALVKSQERLYYNLYNFPTFAPNKNCQLLGTLKHHYTQYQLTLNLYSPPKNSPLFLQSYEFFTPKELKNLPISQMALKIFKFLNVPL
ncbi:MAG: A/G-specific adenine glycosylase [Helicobacter sp.]|nr:A/G-specific adenine glycosylase [Helicobacter sp.]